jgi:hypothetical protein
LIPFKEEIVALGGLGGNNAILDLPFFIPKNNNIYGVWENRKIEMECGNRHFQLVELGKLNGEMKWRVVR